jgi:hypothetical protein
MAGVPGASLSLGAFGFFRVHTLSLWTHRTCSRASRAEV